MQMIRLIIGSQTPEEAVLEVHGWVSGGNVKIVEQEGMRLLEESQRLMLDLKGVKFIDREGLALLKRWSGDRLVLRGASPFVHTLLEKHGLV
jgi:hypothetical protein